MVDKLIRKLMKTFSFLDEDTDKSLKPVQSYVNQSLNQPQEQQITQKMIIVHLCAR